MNSGLSPANPLWIAECLCARLCHEMAGALGALTGSLALAREDDTLVQEAIRLASLTGQALEARLQLLRAAWVGEGAPLDRARLAELAQGLADRRITLVLEGLPSQTLFSPEIGRLALNLVLLGAEALPAGGVVSLALEGRGLVLGIAGPRAEWPAGLMAALEGKASIEGPRALQAPFTLLLAQAAGLRLSLLAPPEGRDEGGTRRIFLALPAGSRIS